MPTDTQRAPTREESELVGGELRLLAAVLLPPGALRDSLLIAIAKRVREAEAGGDDLCPCGAPAVRYTDDDVHVCQACYDAIPSTGPEAGTGIRRGDGRPWYPVECKHGYDCCPECDGIAHNPDVVRSDKEAPMPETKPTLRECVEAEREATDAVVACPWSIHDEFLRRKAVMTAARAATDEAVRAVEVEARVLRGTLRNLRWHLTGRYENELVKMINDVVPPDEDTTGGASDE